MERNKSTISCNDKKGFPANNSYKLEQLRKMLAVEDGSHGDSNAGYGAHLTHWYGNKIAPIQLDCISVKALIKHYEERDEKEGEKMDNEGAIMRKTFDTIDEVRRKIDKLDDIWCDIENSGQIPIGHKYRGLMRRVDTLVCSTRNAIQECVDAANEAGIEGTGEFE